MGVLTTALRTAEVTPAAAAPTGTGSSNVWVVVAVTLLGSSVIAGLITTVLGNLRATAATRREGYANAVRSLIARGEYPYRVRRRVSDEPDVLAALVSRGHDLQEQLAACRTWVNSEHRAMGELFDKALSDIDASVKPATRDAWDQPPITTASGMNLNGWSPGDQWPHVGRLERAIAYRFGWRRLLPRRCWRMDA
ncbi:hypothetical protein ACF3NS_14085 [Arsenicicoccus cauae]|uniref:hypothetical protein n=1 Tax=Arsenicicoccus cauae TaxID=2663847 RepID=UPI00370D9E39